MRSKAAMPTMLQPMQFLLCLYCVLLMGTLCSPRMCNFGIPRQMSLNEVREREGHAMRKKAPHSSQLSRSERMLLGKITSASKTGTGRQFVPCLKTILARLWPFIPLQWMQLSDAKNTRKEPPYTRNVNEFARTWMNQFFLQAFGFLESWASQRKCARFGIQESKKAT